MRRVDDRLGVRSTVGDVVAVEGDVDVAERELGRDQLLEMGVEAAGEDRAAGVDSDDRDGGAAVIGIVVAGGPGVLLDDLVRDAHQRPA